MTRSATSTGASVEPKPDWKSRTFWVNAIALVASVSGALSIDLGLTPERQTQVVVVIMAVINLVLRYVTHSPIRLSLIESKDKVQSAWPAAVLVVLVFILVGCASRQAETPAQRVFALQADYNAMLAVAVAYESQPRCGPVVAPPCSKAAVVDQLRRADDHAFDALQSAQRVIRSNDARESPLQVAMAAAVEAVGLFRRTLEREKIR